jgi:transcriptional regulator with XRE-family HTH domain
MLAFPSRLKQARTAKGYTMTELAEKASQPISTLSRLEAGSRLPSVDQLLALANALQCSTDFLLDREDKYPILCSNCGGKGVVFLPQVRPHPPTKAGPTNSTGARS